MTGSQILLSESLGRCHSTKFIFSSKVNVAYCCHICMSDPLKPGHPGGKGLTTWFSLVSGKIISVTQAETLEGSALLKCKCYHVFLSLLV